MPNTPMMSDEQLIEFKDYLCQFVYLNDYGKKVCSLIARLDHEIAERERLQEACEVFAEWLRREDVGFSTTTKLSRNTPEGERAWRAWWNENLRLCQLAQDMVKAALSAKESADAEKY